MEWYSLNDANTNGIILQDTVNPNNKKDKHDRHLLQFEGVIFGLFLNQYVHIPPRVRLNACSALRRRLARSAANNENRYFENQMLTDSK